MNKKTLEVRRVLVEGYVQGVGYREFVRRWAVRLGISGWVRNRTDGAVEALVRGRNADLEALLAEMRRGPRGSGVTQLRIVESEVDGSDAVDTFIIRPTL